MKISLNFIKMYFKFPYINRSKCWIGREPWNGVVVVEEMVEDEGSEERGCSNVQATRYSREEHLLYRKATL